MSKNYHLKENEKFGFLQVSPTPTQEEISKFYADEFYSGAYKALNNSALEIQLEDQEFYKGTRDDVLSYVEKHYSKKLNEISLLDIGCGWGQALAYFKEKGIDGYGFDPAPEAVEYGKKLGLNVVVAGLEKMNVFNRRFDVVTLFNVLEHLSDPEAVVKEIKETILVPGGLLIIDVPNEFNDFQTVGQKIHGLKEWWVAPPAHLNYFNNTTLRKLLSGTGYQVLDSQSAFPFEMFLLFGRKYVGDSTLGKTCHKERIQFELNLRRSGKEEKLRAFYRSLAELNLGRQVFVVARA
jgi:2-polyprenyl-3-methyl-5-hydroxy-6-metoxy-1,4-benzoquinol methylase